jgi:hypothetical protein
MKTAFLNRSQDNAVGIAIYMDWLRGHSSSFGRVKNFLLIVQTGSGVHPAFYIMAAGGSLCGVKWLGLEADHLFPTGQENVDLYIHCLLCIHGIVLDCLISLCCFRDA